MSYTHASLFTGIGGFDLGFEAAGFSTEFQCEQDKFCVRVLEHYWPDVKRVEDVADVDGRELEGIDVISGGFPCQDLSVAGRGEGITGARSGLFFQMCRVVAAARPRLLLWENVPGLLSDRDSFAIVLRELADIGYFGAWRVLDSSYFGVPQPRRRVFGAFAPRGAGGWASGAAVLFDGQDGGGPAEAGAGERATIAAAAEAGRPAFAGPGRIATPCMYDGSRQSPTLDVSMLSKRQMLPERQRCPVVVESDRGWAPMFKFAHECVACPDCGEPWCEDCEAHYGDCNCVEPANVDNAAEEIEVDVRARLLLPVECERRQGFPTGWTAVAGMSDTQRYKQLGNAVPVTIAYWLALRAQVSLGG